MRIGWLIIGGGGGVVAARVGGAWDGDSVRPCLQPASIRVQTATMMIHGMAAIFTRPVVFGKHAL